MPICKNVFSMPNVNAIEYILNRTNMFSFLVTRPLKSHPNLVSTPTCSPILPVNTFPVTTDQ